MKVGIVGLPLSGKSTVFNALTSLNVQVRDFSIDEKAKPNLGTIFVPDERLEKLAGVFNPKKVTYTEITLVDMAGIHKGVKPEELDLTPIRDVDELVCVVREFSNEQVLHPYGSIDPTRDLDILETQFILLDLDSATKRTAKLKKEIEGGRHEHKREYDILYKCQQNLQKSMPLRKVSFTEDEDKFLKGYQFLTKKQLLVVANLGEENIKTGPPESLKKHIQERDLTLIEFCGKVEMEISQLDDEKLKQDFLNELGIQQSANEKLIKAIYKTLNLVTFFTTKGEEVRAWAIPSHTKAVDAAGKIHTDMQRGFIRAEVVNFKDFVDSDCSMHVAKEKGHLKTEGKDYIVQDGDILNIKFSV